MSKAQKWFDSLSQDGAVVISSMYNFTGKKSVEEIYEAYQEDKNRDPKPVIKEEKAFHYVSESSMVKFITENSNMEWNTVCKYIHKAGITDEDGKALYEKAEMESKKAEEWYGEEQVKWLRAFFKAHPWIDRMYIVFDD